jgi:hypothetical protein
MPEIRLKSPFSKPCCIKVTKAMGAILSIQGSQNFRASDKLLIDIMFQALANYPARTGGGDLVVPSAVPISPARRVGGRDESTKPIGSANQRLRGASGTESSQPHKDPPASQPRPRA